LTTLPRCYSRQKGPGKANQPANIIISVTTLKSVSLFKGKTKEVLLEAAFPVRREERDD